MENQVVLSLADWPKQPITSHYKVSPTTLRVIKNIKVQLHSLLPISYAQFILQRNLSQLKKNQVEESFNQQLQRRAKKIEIMRQIWLKIKTKRSNSVKQFQTTRHSYLTKREEKKPQRNSSRSLQGHKFGRKQKSPLFYQGKPPKYTSTYFDYYNTCQKKRIKYKNCQEQESTQSRPQKTNSSKNMEQYFNVNKQKIKTQGSTGRHKQNLLISINQMLRKWSQLDSRHMSQLQQITNISDKERKRLLKIHQIQKQKLRRVIQNLRRRIASLKNIKNFT